VQSRKDGSFKVLNPGVGEMFLAVARGRVFGNVNETAVMQQRHAATLCRHAAARLQKRVREPRPHKRCIS
jgi:hypothetical protein